MPLGSNKIAGFEKTFPANRGLIAFCLELMFEIFADDVLDPS
jgi:hypothetical protein